MFVFPYLVDIYDLTIGDGYDDADLFWFDLRVINSIPNEFSTTILEIVIVKRAKVACCISLFFLDPCIATYAS